MNLNHSTSKIIECKFMLRFIHHIPIKAIGILVAGWIGLALTIVGLKVAGFRGNVPTSFPISVFTGPTFHFNGLMPLFLFLTLVAFSLRSAPKLTAFQIWLIGFTLIILGNLGQGGWWQAFVEPFYKSGIQYYSDAIRIESWSRWLESFNSKQTTFLMHTRTHPPFAVLIHYFILRVGAYSVPMLGFVFALTSSLSILIVRQIFQILHVPLGTKNLLSILFSVIPAINIYSAVSLDGIILTSTTLCLLGIVMLLERGKIFSTGLIVMGVGMILTNLLTFTGVFLFAVAGFLSVIEFIDGRPRVMTIALLIILTLFLSIDAILVAEYGYHYFQSFLVASMVENPTGFRGYQEPLEYFLTRMECVCEIALFLSFGFLAYLFHPSTLNASYVEWQRLESRLMISGVVVLIAMFISGAYQTGETARAAIFIYPYLLFSLKNAGSPIIKNIIILAALQTAAMQLLGDFYW